MKAAIVGMLNNVSNSQNHHGGGYSRIMVRIIKESIPEVKFTVNPEPSTWNEYDCLCILEGVNYQENTFNFIGGPQPEHIEKLKAILDYKGTIKFINKSLDFSQFNKRFSLEGEFPTGKTINFATKYGEKTKKVVIGDSHSLSVWKPGFGLNRTDGRTLYGFLNRATPDEFNSKYDETITYFGNIDLRFHLIRQSDPKQATKDLFNKYIDFSLKLNNNTIVKLLPVENESRKLPGTGLYLKKAYFGTREERMELREIAHDILDKSGIKTIDWPNEWIDKDGTKMFEYMEPKQSVHLRPRYYKFAKEYIS